MLRPNPDQVWAGLPQRRPSRTHVVPPPSKHRTLVDDCDPRRLQLRARAWLGGPIRQPSLGEGQGGSGRSREALAADRPCIVEFLTDPAVPPVPPHASWDQIEKALESIVRGDSDRVDVIKEGLKSKIQEFLPGTKRRPRDTEG